MYIGEISKITGASIKAIRLYEELGLLNDVERLGKYRVYDDNHVVFVRLIVKAKSLGFRLSELKSFVGLESSKAPWECILDMITSKQKEIDAKMTELKKQKKELSNHKKTIMSCLAKEANCALDETTLDSTPRGIL